MVMGSTEIPQISRIMGSQQKPTHSCQREAQGSRGQPWRNRKGVSISNYLSQEGAGGKQGFLQGGDRDYSQRQAAGAWKQAP